MISNDLIQVTPSGIKVATFEEVRQHFTNKMFEIYGNDIDLSTASADGQWLYHVAYIIYSLLQLNEHAFNMLDPVHANGKYLDIIASFNNIKRLNATASTTTLIITNNSGSDKNISAITKFSDIYGNEWEIIDTNQNLTLKNNTSKNIDVRCTKVGYVIANAGDINNMSNPSLSEVGLSIEQPYDAIVGTERETDSDLRYRRSHNGNAHSISVVDGLKQALENLIGVSEVSIIENYKNEQNQQDDNIIIKPHSIGVRIRLSNSNISNLDTQIFNTIYNKLTPGVDCEVVAENTVEYGTIKSHTLKIAQSITNSNIPVEYSINFSWKECSIYNNFKYIINLLILDASKFTGAAIDSPADTEQEKAIAEALIKYFNTISINDLPQTNQIILNVMGAQLSLSGYTYYVKEAVLDTSSVEKFDKCKYGYFNITSDNIKFKKNLDNTITITVQSL